MANNKEKQEDDTLFTNYLSERIIEEISPAAERVLSDLPDMIENHLRRKIKNLLGVDESFNRARIDSNSPLSDHLKEHAVEYARKALGQINLHIDDKQEEAIRDEYARVFADEIKSIIRTKAKKDAEQVYRDLADGDMRALTKNLTIDQIEQLSNKELKVNKEVRTQRTTSTSIFKDMITYKKSSDD